MELNKSSKGVISVFLIICFTMTFVFSGLLVDGGRVRLARGLAESSMDNAASSALSYYDELLFDLYGMFAMGGTQEDTEKQIQERMNRYFEETLSLLPGDHSELKKALGASLNKEDFFDGYDFKLEEPLTVESKLSMADTFVTEYQIIEHMKYRAPLQLIDNNYGFLNNVRGLLQIKTRLEAVKDKRAITKQYESTINSGAPLLKRIVQHRKECLKLKDFKSMDAKCKEFDKNIGDGGIFLQYKNQLKKNLPKKDETTTSETSADTTVSTNPAPAQNGRSTASQNNSSTSQDGNSELTKIEKRKDNKVKDFENDWSNIEQKMKSLNDENLRLRQEVSVYVEAMENYIQALEAKNKEKGNEDYKTVFGPEIDLAKSTVGEMLINKGALLHIGQYLNVEGLDIPTNLKAIKTEVDRQYTEIKTFASAEGITEQDIENKKWESLKKLHLMSVTAKEVDIKLNKILELSEKFMNINEDLPKTAPTYKLKPSEHKKHEEIDKHLKSINGNDLEGGSNLGIQGGQKAESNPNQEPEKMLDQGIDLVGNLMNLLEQGRDNIYVNEYILSNFRNYVHHGSEEARGNLNKSGYDSVIAGKFLGDDEKYRKTDETIVGEVEYILAGNTNQYLNIAYVSGQILLIRTMFNMAAIFTDTSKIQIATALAGAAGPFAPLVSFAILTGWAVAESVVDVSKIFGGEKVVLFKQGADWEIGSIEKAFENVVKKTVESVSDAIANEAASYINTKCNAAVYEYYKKPQQEFRSVINQKIQEVGDIAGPEVAGKLSEVANGSFEEINNYEQTILDKKDEALMKLSEVYKTERSKFAEKVAQGVGSAIITVQNPRNTGASTAFNVKLGYSDYLRILLLLQNKDTKISRVQQMMQLNVRQRGGGDFRMKNTRVEVYAKAKISIRYLFMTEAVVPSEFRKDGRYKFGVSTSLSY